MKINRLLEQRVKEERNEALLSLDRAKIEAYFKKWNGYDMKPTNDYVFWLSIKKALMLLTIDEKEKETAIQKVESKMEESK